MFLREGAGSVTKKRSDRKIERSIIQGRDDLAIRPWKLGLQLLVHGARRGDLIIFVDSYIPGPLGFGRSMLKTSTLDCPVKISSAVNIDFRYKMQTTK